MSPLRARLIAALVGAALAVGLVASAAAYLAARAEVGALLDEQLRQVASSLRDVARLDLRALGRVADPGQQVVVQVWDPSGGAIYASDATPPLPLTRTPGFTTLEHDGRRWRMFTALAGLRTIEVAPPTATRTRLAAEAAPQQQGMGSGFIVSGDGTILTNAHVVDGAAEVLVRLTDRRELKARVVGVDRKSDVAVIRVDARRLPTVKIGNPSTLRVGEWVAAIGSPFGLENTVTAGIVSAKSRNVGDDGLVPFVPTDVAVDPGNSGGPLLNLAGEVVGVDSMIFSRSGGFMGVSFAIPIDVAMRVKDDLVQYGKVTRGRIGVAVQQVTPPLAETFGLDRPRGALVSPVDPEGPRGARGPARGRRDRRRQRQAGDEPRGPEARRRRRARPRRAARAARRRPPVRAGAAGLTAGRAAAMSRRGACAAPRLGQRWPHLAHRSRPRRRRS